MFGHSIPLEDAVDGRCSAVYLEKHNSRRSKVLMSHGHLEPLFSGMVSYSVAHPVLVKAKMDQESRTRDFMSNPSLPLHPRHIGTCNALVGGALHENSTSLTSFETGSRC